MVDIGIKLLELLGKLFGWATREIRITRRVAKSARQLNLQINRKLFRELISAPGFQDRFEAQDAKGRLEVELELAGTIRNRTGDAEEVRVLRAILSRAYLTMLAGGSSALGHKDALDDARATRVASAVSTAVEDRALFEGRLAALHPVRAQQIRDLASVWEPTLRLIGLYSESPDTQLAYWASFPPPILRGAPALMFGALADLAHDRDLDDAAEKFIERALAEGIEPAGYWTVRLMHLKSVSDRDDAADFLSAFRGYPLAEATIAENGREAAREVLINWRPEQVAEELHRRVLLGELYLADLLLDEAVDLAMDTARQYVSTGAELLAARAMMTRAMVGNSPLHRYDISDALALATKARAARISWSMSSGGALALILRLMRMLSDVRGALRFAEPPPKGQAVPSELNDPDVLHEVALLHALRGDTVAARRLAESLGDRRSSDVIAAIADSGEVPFDSLAAWERALEVTDDWGEKADVALQLALRGRQPAFLDQLEESNRDIADELRLIAALFSEQPGALERFRAFANSSYRGTLFLLRFYQEHGDVTSGSLLAEEGARAWNDSTLWVESAKYKYDSGNHEGAISDLHACLVAALPGWGGRRDTYRRLVEAYSVLGKWHDARNAAAQLLAEDPEDPDAAWALIVCQLRVTDFSGALATWRARGNPEPRTEMQAGAWIELLQHFGDDFAGPTEALRVAALWPTHEPIRRSLVAGLFTGGGREARNAQDAHVADAARADAATLLQDYLRDFPDGGIWSVQIDEDDPLGSLSAAFGEAVDTSEVDQSIFDGGLPAGFSGEIHRKGYLEVLITKRAGPIHSGTRAPETERQAIVRARSSSVVVDTSAIFARAILPDDIGDLLTGHFALARGVSEQHRDAVNAVERFREDQGLSIIPPRQGQPPTVSYTDDEERARRLAVAAKAEETFRGLVATSHPAITAIAPLQSEDFRTPLFAALDYAVATGCVLWCDDRLLRQIAEGEGASTFGTLELIGLLRQEGGMDESQLDVAEATLIAAGFTGAHFDLRVWTLSASLGNTPGMLNSIRFANGDEVQSRVSFALQQVDAHAQSPELLAGAVNAVGRWLVAIAGDPASARSNLVILSRNLLTRPWMGSSSLPFCLDALRALERIDDPVGVALGEVFSLYQSFQSRIGDPGAAERVFELVSLCPEPDARRVRSAILTGTFS